MLQPPNSNSPRHREIALLSLGREEAGVRQGVGRPEEQAVSVHHHVVTDAQREDVRQRKELEEA